MPNLYPRHKLPQWTITDVIKHDYSYYFGMELYSNLQPSQQQSDYQPERIQRKYEMMQVGQFDPIIVDYQMNIICGHHRHKVLLERYDRLLCPIICLEGVAVEDVVKYYAGIKAHAQALNDRAIENYDYDYLVGSFK